MSWYVLDAVDGAFERTRKCLFDPFDFWKWVKLIIIGVLIGGGANFNGGSGNLNTFDGSDVSAFKDMPTGHSDLLHSISDNIAADALGYLIAAILLILLLVLILSYISSLMEYVLVESLVSNDVRFREYSRRFLGKGFGLFLLRLMISVIYLVIIATITLPFILYIIRQPEEAVVNSIIAMLVYFLFIFIFAGLILAVVGAIINSFVNLAIPVSLYTGSDIFRAVSMVLKKFRQDWEQMIVYWAGRTILSIAVTIAVIIGVVIVLAIAALMLLAIDGLLYFTLSALLSGSESAVWMILIPLVLVQIFLLMLIIGFVTMPARVFVKYHMLTFLQMWYPQLEIPMFDRLQLHGDHF
ncbi:MAG: hypothetical protein JW705_06240 [Methanosarcinaceae archaeon]|nr:hypothetical protein [Methanosarcinaceae archaeon]